MRRVNNVSAEQATSQHRAVVEISNNDASEKDAKIRRSKAKRTKAIVTSFGVLALFFLSVFVKMKHNKYSHPLRGLRRVREYEKWPTDSDSLISNNDTLARKVLHQHSAVTTSLPLNSIYRLSTIDSSGEVVSLLKYAGMVSLVVNVACKWGKTAVSYGQLKELQTKLGPFGFGVLAFPTNDYHQEYETDAEIQSFVSDNFQPNFPVFGTSSLGENPVYQQLQRHLPDTSIKHNFFKYLVNRQGVAVHLFDKKQDPLSFSDEIEELIRQNEEPVYKYVTQ